MPTSGNPSEIGVETSSSADVRVSESFSIVERLGTSFRVDERLSKSRELELGIETKYGENLEMGVDSIVPFVRSCSNIFDVLIDELSKEGDEFDAEILLESCTPIFLVVKLPRMLIVSLDDESSFVCMPYVPVSDVLELSDVKEGLTLNLVLIPFDINTAVGTAWVNVGRISAVFVKFTFLE